MKDSCGKAERYVNVSKQPIEAILTTNRPTEAGRFVLSTSPRICSPLPIGRHWPAKRNTIFVTPAPFFVLYTTRLPTMITDLPEPIAYPKLFAALLFGKRPD